MQDLTKLRKELTLAKDQISKGITGEAALTLVKNIVICFGPLEITQSPFAFKVYLNDEDQTLIRESGGRKIIQTEAGAIGLLEMLYTFKDDIKLWS